MESARRDVTFRFEDTAAAAIVVLFHYRRPRVMSYCDLWRNITFRRNSLAFREQFITARGRWLNISRLFNERIDSKRIFRK